MPKYTWNRVITFVLCGLLLTGCSLQPKGPEPKTPAVPSVPPQQQPVKPGELPMKVSGQNLVFGPFSSYNRGLDHFWLPDGSRLLVTVTGAGGEQQLWLVDPKAKASRLLREAKGIDAIFPIGFAGGEKVVILEIPAVASAKNAVYSVDFSGDNLPARVTLVNEFTGRVKRQAITRDGRFVTIHYNNEQGGCLVRLDTSSNTRKELFSGLPVDDGLYPVWFSPDGTQAAMPERSSKDVRLRLVSIMTGETRSTKYSMKMVDFVKWSPNGKHLAFKLADGSHRTMESGDFYVVQSQKIRVAQANGEILKDLVVPQSRFAANLAWLDNASLAVQELKSQNETGSTWVLGLDGSIVTATEAQKAAATEPAPYPMPKGGSALLQVSVRNYQDQGKPPAQELIISPKR